MAVCRKRLRAPSPEGSSEAVSLQAALHEIRQLREELRERQAEYASNLRQQQTELEQLQERMQRTSIQLSPSNNREITASVSNRVASQTSVREESHYKLKPDIYDGSAPLREFFSQFNLIARANRWDEGMKSAVLVSCLRGKARAVLESLQDLENIEFADLKEKLELRFGENLSSQNYYCQFTNRKQKFGESLAFFAADLERLSQMAYPECPHSVRDKIACAQFVSALSDNFVKRTLQLEGVTSLRIATERAKTIKFIRDNNFYEKKENNFNYGKRKEWGENNKEKKTSNEDEEKKNKNSENKRFDKFNKKRNINNKECWQCGKMGHFRAECPGNTGNQE